MRVCAYVCVCARARAWMRSRVRCVPFRSYVRAPLCLSVCLSRLQYAVCVNITYDPTRSQVVHVTHSLA